VAASYSDVANQQLDEIAASGNVDLYNGLITVCEWILDNPGLAQEQSSAITTGSGIVFRCPVPGLNPYKVFWTSAGPSVEAVFPHP
jgi:hypothetical protein